VLGQWRQHSRQAHRRLKSTARGLSTRRTHRLSFSQKYFSAPPPNFVLSFRREGCGEQVVEGISDGARALGLVLGSGPYRIAPIARFLMLVGRVPQYGIGLRLRPTTLVS